MGFVLLVPTPGPDSQLLVRSTGAEWWEGKETQITLEINNDSSFIESLWQDKALPADAALIIAPLKKKKIRLGILLVNRALGHFTPRKLF